MLSFHLAEGLSFLVTYGVSFALSRRYADFSSKWQRMLVSEWPTTGRLSSCGIRIAAMAQTSRCEG